MSVKFKRDESAQTSLFDAMMFFIIMLIASALIFVFSSQAFQTQEVISREDMMTYTEETRSAILQSTIYETHYYDKNDDKIEKPPGSTNINGLLLEELALLDDSVPQENFVEGYEKDIKETINRLIRSGYTYALEASYDNETSGTSYEIFISQKEKIPTSDVTTSQWSSPMINGKPGDAIIKLSIWKE